MPGIPLTLPDDLLAPNDAAASAAVLASYAIRVGSGMRESVDFRTGASMVTFVYGSRCGR